MRLPFTKMQGLGNDFIVIDLRDDPSLQADVSERAGPLCDRHLGVGADGVLLVLPSGVAAARMQVWNADGSEAEMCGNGLRCVARYLYEAGLTERPLPIETGAGVLPCEVYPSDLSVTVAMGRPDFPKGAAGPPGAISVRLGNPHLVQFIDDPAVDLRALATQAGPALASQPPGGTNVEFARIDGTAIELWVWERGCGITLACGTGACATVAAACHSGRLEGDAWHTVRLPGGPLQVRISAGQLDMRGPARPVFAGQLNLYSF